MDSMQISKTPYNPENWLNNLKRVPLHNDSRKTSFVWPTNCIYLITGPKIYFDKDSKQFFQAFIIKISFPIMTRADKIFHAGKKTRKQ